MFHQKRRSMLGRRHLMAQQKAQSKAVQPQPVTASGDGSSSKLVTNNSWRGRQSEKKRTPNNFDRASTFKKRLFSQSPTWMNKGPYSKQIQDRNHYLSNENLNETGVSSIVPTPSSSSRHLPITPATSQQLRAEMVTSRYGPSSSETTLSSTFLKQTSSSYDLKDLKPPDPPGPSQLEKLLREENMGNTSSSCDFLNLKPPDSPGPSRLERLLMEENLNHISSIYNLKTPTSPGPSSLDKIIMEEKLEQPLDPGLKTFQSLTIEDPNTRLQFSPPLSSTCIGSPDSGKKNTIVKEEMKELRLGSRKKLSAIQEDCDVSVIEFELNERTVNELDKTLMESSANITVMPNNASHSGNILEDHNSNHTEGSEQSWETMLLRLDDMERAAMNRAVNNTNTMEKLKQQIENLQKKNEEECLEEINNIRSMKKTLESFKHTTKIAPSTENKENNFAFKVPTCKKKQLVEESKWLSSVKAENPGLLKTPNPDRKINQSAVWTPRSLSKVLHDQMNELYD